MRPVLVALTLALLTQIDRYILGSFLKNYVIALVVLIGLYVMMDAFFNFDELGRGGEDATFGDWMRGIGSYYLAQALFIYGQLAGVIPVVAAAFTLMRMSRFNELTALLAAGVPLLRVAAPVVLASLAINLIVQPINQEFVIPRLAGWLTLERWEAAAGEREAYAIEPTQAGDGQVFLAGRFMPAVPGEDVVPQAELVTIVRRDEQARTLSLTTADIALFDEAAGGWQLTNGRRVDDLIGAGDMTGVRPPDAQVLDFWETALRPVDLELAHAADLSVGAGGSYFDLLSTRQIHNLLSRPGGGVSADLLRAKHARLSGHFMNLVLILLAVPAVLTRQPGALRLAARRTLIVVGLAMGATFACQMAAREPPPFLSDALLSRWPATMAWLPVLIFGPLAVVQLDRMES